jgi:hypothetical protein
MRRHAHENARQKRAPHRYTLEQFGIEEETLRRDFAPYAQRFLA